MAQPSHSVYRVSCPLVIPCTMKFNHFGSLMLSKQLLLSVHITVTYYILFYPTSEHILFYWLMIHANEKHRKGSGSPYLINYPKEGFHPSCFPTRGLPKRNKFGMQTLSLSCATMTPPNQLQRCWSGKANKFAMIG